MELKVWEPWLEQQRGRPPAGRSLQPHQLGAVRILTGSRFLLTWRHTPARVLFCFSHQDLWPISPPPSSLPPLTNCALTSPTAHICPTPPPPGPAGEGAGQAERRAGQGPSGNRDSAAVPQGSREGWNPEAAAGPGMQGGEADFSPGVASHNPGRWLSPATPKNHSWPTNSTSASRGPARPGLLTGLTPFLEPQGPPALRAPRVPADLVPCGRPGSGLRARRTLGPRVPAPAQPSFPPAPAANFFRRRRRLRPRLQLGPRRSPGLHHACCLSWSYTELADAPTGPGAAAPSRVSGGRKWGSACRTGGRRGRGAGGPVGHCHSTGRGRGGGHLAGAGGLWVVRC